MRIPQTPPVTADPAGASLAELRRMVRVFAVVHQPTHKGRYVHWDKLSAWTVRPNCGNSAMRSGGTVLRCPGVRPPGLCR